MSAIKNAVFGQPTVAPVAPFAPGAVAPYGSVAPYGAFGGFPCSGSVDAYGKPVYKKKWLFGKWQYAGMKDVKYVPSTTVAAPVYNTEFCAPVSTGAEFCNYSAPVVATGAEFCNYSAPVATNFGGACF